MFEKIKTYQKHPYMQQLRDVRVLGLLVFVMLVLLTTWSGIKVIQTNYELARRVASLEQEVEVRQLENANLRLRNQYYETDEFLELAARRQFGRAAPGEKLMLVPKEVALSHTVDLSGKSKTTAEQPQEGDKPAYQRNFEAWVNFFLHRTPSDTNPRPNN
jgi:cell division protein FtsB